MAKSTEKLKKDFILYIEAELADIEFMEDAIELLGPLYEIINEEESFEEFIENDELEDLKENAVYNIEKYLSQFRKEEDIVNAIAEILNKTEEDVKSMFLSE